MKVHIFLYHNQNYWAQCSPSLLNHVLNENVVTFSQATNFKNTVVDQKKNSCPSQIYKNQISLQTPTVRIIFS